MKTPHDPSIRDLQKLIAKEERLDQMLWWNAMTPRQRMAALLAAGPQATPGDAYESVKSQRQPTKRLADLRWNLSLIEGFRKKWLRENGQQQEA